MKIRCYIIDDEPLATKVLEKFLIEFPEFEIVGIQTNPVKALNELERLRVDLLFLDINMPKLAGLELLELIEQKPYVIFTTAYGKHALESFKYKVVDYLVKPISFSRFTKSIKKVGQILKARQEYEVKRQNEIFFLKDGKVVKQVIVKDILYVKTEGDYLIFFCKNKRVVVHSSMKKMAAELKDHPIIRVHQSFMVNTHYIKAFSGNLVTVEESKIPVGRAFRDELMSFLSENKLS